MGRVGIGRTKNRTGVAVSTATGCASAKPGAKARTVADGTTDLEPESSPQHVPAIVGPSDVQQSSAAIWEQTRQGHSARTRLKTVTAKRPRRSRRNPEVTILCITPGPKMAMMQVIYWTWPARPAFYRVHATRACDRLRAYTTGKPKTMDFPAVHLLGCLRLLRAGAVFPAITLAALVASAGCFAARFAFHGVISEGRVIRCLQLCKADAGRRPRRPARATEGLSLFSPARTQPCHSK